ncbi:MAG: exodeoxyribonuclease III [Ramlibacter sp.]
MKIATYNVNGVNGRLPRLLEWLEETRPDIACLQEIKTSDPRFPIEALRQAGYDAVWHGQPRHHGVAILARGERPQELRRGLPTDGDEGQARYLEARVGELRIASVYLPNGNPQPGPKFDHKLDWFARFNRHAQQLLADGQPTVLAGDFNVVPTDFDIDNAWAWQWDAVMQPQTRRAYEALLAQGWTDATRHLHPHERIYTYWVHTEAFRRNAGFRMDFLLASPDLRDRLAATGVDTGHRGREKPSDHAPVWLELRSPSPAAGRL